MTNLNKYQRILDFLSRNEKKWLSAKQISAATNMPARDIGQQIKVNSQDEIISKRLPDQTKIYCYVGTAEKK